MMDLLLRRAPSESSRMDLAIPKSSKKVALLPKSPMMDLALWRSFLNHQGSSKKVPLLLEAPSYDGLVASVLLPKSSRVDLLLRCSFRNHQGWTWLFRNNPKEVALLP
jgi:hypothetical protein